MSAEARTTRPSRSRTESWASAAAERAKCRSRSIPVRARPRPRRPMPKITVVGAGNVGASAALYAAEAELGDVTLVDVIEGVAKGKALDLLEAGPVRGYDAYVEGSGDIKAVRGSDLI